MILLNVPYAEKDDAKLLGAKWDATAKKWYVPKGTLAALFERWMPGGDVAEKLLAKLPAKPKTAKPGGASGRAKRRVDSSGGKITTGANYAPMEGATGLPWDA